MHWHILDWASFSSKYQISDFFSRLMRAAKVQARLCIGINLTEPSLLENAIRTTFPVLFSHSLINASSECSGKTAHYYKLIWDFVNVSKNVELANCCQKPLTLAQARLIDRCLTVVKFVTLGLGQILTYLNWPKFLRENQPGTKRDQNRH